LLAGAKLWWATTTIDHRWRDAAHILDFEQVFPIGPSWNKTTAPPNILKAAGTSSATSPTMEKTFGPKTKITSASCITPGVATRKRPLSSTGQQLARKDFAWRLAVSEPMPVGIFEDELRRRIFPASSTAGRDYDRMEIRRPDTSLANPAEAAPHHQRSGRGIRVTVEKGGTARRAQHPVVEALPFPEAGVTGGTAKKIPFISCLASLHKGESRTCQTDRAQLSRRIARRGHA
jgi:hypothetical protein